jgi:serine/threonine protein kinase
MRSMHRALVAEREELLRLNRQLQRARQETVEVFELLAEQLQGKVLSNKYRLEERIGTGGSAIVYRATHLQLQRSVAIKVLRPKGISRSAHLLERFSREATSSARLRHANVVEVQDADVTTDGLPYLVMELLSGQALCDALQPGVPLSVARALEILIPICRAVKHAHSVGILHRDIKPANIFLHRDEGGEVVKLLDFGIAQFFDSSDGNSVRARSGEDMVGTLCYMSPEQMEGVTCDGKTDVYSLGVTLYELLTGQLPFPCGRDGTLATLRQQMKGPIRPPSALVSTLSKTMDRIVLGLLEPCPSSRPAVSELLSQLTALTALFTDLTYSEPRSVGPSRRSPVIGAGADRTEGHS